MLDLKSTRLELQQLAEQLKVVAEPNRLRILQTLMEGYQCNCELGEVLEMPPNLISHHLRVLRQVGLVEMERDQHDARWVYYSIDVEAMQKLCAAFGAFFDVNRIQPRRNTCGPTTTSKIEIGFLSE